MVTMVWIGGIIILLMVFIVALLFIFWILMLVDAITRKFKGDGEKIAWVLVILFGNFIGALVYYLVIYMKDKKKSLKWLWISLLIGVAVFVLLAIIIFSMGITSLKSFAI